MEDTTDPVRKADYYHEHGMWKESEAILLELVRRNPDDFDAYYRLGCLQEELLEYNQACTYFLSALQLQPDNFNVLYKLAGIAMLVGHLDDAADYYRRCLAINEGSLRANYNMGLICYRRNDWLGAAKYFSIAAELGDDYPDIWYMLGMSLKAIGRWQQAEESMRKAVEVSPDRAEIHFHLGDILLHLQQFEAAEKFFQNSVKIAPENPQYWLGLGRLYFQWGKNDLAREKLQTVMEIDKNNDTAQLLLKSLNGQQVTRMPGELLASMFNQCSESFDSYMVNELKYSLPKQLRDAVSTCCRKLDQPQQFDWVLDLGCGTGLASEQFMPVSKTMVGVDISPGMIEQAKAKNIYQKLVCGDLLQVMDSAVHKYNLVLAADVFIYIGDLEKTFAAVSRHTVPGAWFAFSIECGEGEADYILNRSGVFAHSPAYIARLAARCGFDVTLEKLSENQNFPNVMIYVLRKS